MRPPQQHYQTAQLVYHYHCHDTSGYQLHRCDSDSQHSTVTANGESSSLKSCLKQQPSPSQPHNRQQQQQQSHNVIDLAFALPRKRVYFNALHDETRVFTDLVTEAEKPAVWYAADDFLRFGSDMQGSAARVQDRLAQAAHFLPAYRYFRSLPGDDHHEAADEQLLMRLLSWQQQQQHRQQYDDDADDDAHCLRGLETAHADMQADYHLRRRHLMDQCRRLQAAGCQDAGVDARAWLCETSRLASHGPRLYARYVGILASRRRRR